MSSIRSCYFFLDSGLHGVLKAVKTALTASWNLWQLLWIIRIYLCNAFNGTRSLWSPVRSQLRSRAIALAKSAIA